VGPRKSASNRALHLIRPALSSVSPWENTFGQHLGKSTIALPWEKIPSRRPRSSSDNLWHWSWHTHTRSLHCNWCVRMSALLSASCWRHPRDWRLKFNILVFAHSFVDVTTGVSRNCVVRSSESPKCKKGILILAPVHFGHNDWGVVTALKERGPIKGYEFEARGSPAHNLNVKLTVK